MRRTVAVLLLMVFFSMTLTYSPIARADDRDHDRDDQHPAGTKTATPIKHVVVIFDENNSFDHYFGTYPFATNPSGEPEFHPDPDTPLVNGFTYPLLYQNPNFVNTTVNPTNPFLLPRNMYTCDNDNHYTDEQIAFDGGLMDKFTGPLAISNISCNPAGTLPPNIDPAGLPMGYYDGNTVTALWNYAQHFAMSDNFFDTEFGTTSMGHINLISGQTHGVTVKVGPAKPTTITAGNTVIANVQPYFDNCTGITAPQIAMTGANVGNLLNTANVTWGWFYGDFGASVNGVLTCIAPSPYNSHYDPFQLYPSTANPNHTPPASPAVIGKSDCAVTPVAGAPAPPAGCANHQYDLSWFQRALDTGNLPAVSFIKASSNNTGHPSNSGPLDEQTFLVKTITSIMESRYWGDTAIFIAWDDSDGWYDHVMPPIVSTSADASNDALFGTGPNGGLCGPAPRVFVNGVATGAGYADRCGYGERLPFLVISPYAKRNYVDHSLNDTTSILRFIEDNWGLGGIGDQSFDALAGSLLGMFDFDEHHDRENRELILDPSTGQRMGRWW